MNIMIVTNSAYLKPTYIMLYSLFLHHQQEEIDIYLPYEDISENELEELTAFVIGYEKNYIRYMLEMSLRQKCSQETELMSKLIIVYLESIYYQNQWKEFYIWM